MPYEKSSKVVPSLPYNSRSTSPSSWSNSIETVSPGRPALGSVKRYQSRSSNSMLSAVSDKVPLMVCKSVAVAAVSLSS